MKVIEKAMENILWEINFYGRLSPYFPINLKEKNL